MFQRIIYTISIISLVLLTMITIEMIPLIYQTGWQGIIFLILVLLVLIFELVVLFRNKRVVKKAISYNVFLILITMYLGIMYYKIYALNLDLTFLYDIDINYCKDNYLLLSLALILVIFNLLIMNIDFRRKEK